MEDKTQYFSKVFYEELQKAQKYLEEYLEANCEYLARQKWECGILPDYRGYSFQSNVEQATVVLTRRKYPRRMGDPDVWGWEVKGANGYNDSSESLEHAVECVKTCLVKDAKTLKSSANSILNHL